MGEGVVNMSIGSITLTHYGRGAAFRRRNTSNGMCLRGNSTEGLSFIPSGDVSLVYARPPCTSVVRCDRSVPRSLSLLGIGSFLRRVGGMTTRDCHILGGSGFYTILVNSAHRGNRVVPVSFSIVHVFRRSKFGLGRLVVGRRRGYGTAKC